MILICWFFLLFISVSKTSQDGYLFFSDPSEGEYNYLVTLSTAYMLQQVSLEHRENALLFESEDKDLFLEAFGQYSNISPSGLVHYCIEKSAGSKGNSDWDITFIAAVLQLDRLSIDIMLMANRMRESIVSGLKWKPGDAELKPFEILIFTQYLFFVKPEQLKEYSEEVLAFFSFYFVVHLFDLHYLEPFYLDVEYLIVSVRHFSKNRMILSGLPEIKFIFDLTTDSLSDLQALDETDLSEFESESLILYKIDERLELFEKIFNHSFTTLVIRIDKNADYSAVFKVLEKQNRLEELYLLSDDEEYSTERLLIILERRSFELFISSSLATEKRVQSGRYALEVPDLLSHLIYSTASIAREESSLIGEEKFIILDCLCRFYESKNFRKLPMFVSNDQFLETIVYPALSNSIQSAVFDLLKSHPKLQSKFKRNPIGCIKASLGWKKRFLSNENLYSQLLISLGTVVKKVQRYPNVTVSERVLAARYILSLEDMEKYLNLSFSDLYSRLLLPKRFVINAFSSWLTKEAFTCLKTEELVIEVWSQMPIEDQIAHLKTLFSSNGIKSKIQASSITISFWRFNQDILSILAAQQDDGFRITRLEAFFMQSEDNLKKIRELFNQPSHTVELKFI